MTPDGTGAPGTAPSAAGSAVPAPRPGSTGSGAADAAAATAAAEISGAAKVSGTAALAHVRARSTGPLPLGPGEAAPPGMARLGRGDGTGLALPAWPDGTTPSLLAEYQASPVAVERSGETRRVLAAALKCCWSDLTADPWPGTPAPVDDVLAAYRALIGRADDLMRNWAVGALRRLHDSAWLVVADGTVRLGPRCASWPAASHAQLRELVRRLPGPGEEGVPAVLPVAGETGHGAAAGLDLPEGVDDDLLAPFDERRRAEVVAAFMAVEHAAEPVHEARFPALRDPVLRRVLAEMLRRRGRVLVSGRETWTSGYADDVAAEAGTALGEAERAVLVLVLVHSVAIPRAEGLLPADSWLSPFPAQAEELRRHTLLPIGELEAALRTLRHAGLVTQVKSGEEAGGYVPGPQFHRLTPAARRRLQEELILAAGPHTPLAAAVRARRR
ncbi:hypothetical protein Ppa06_40870 [Planomonospora parontospora subsp. parontospora]|uniref:Uncharacterized protein n=2 Tax=Planomonospora parontospora TaxID=58119 RepID=A0AA37F5U7_9ACTN|nr:hypothetical protein [Planomonospora parontospora]GGK78728.1 hypothetical protein GCM10010126_42680 [Planomonospora parontospora]GII10289.1 hypothetical protein Ppa06_40870 [Planomonospora parontospora subsp. parontospora]